MPLILMFSVYCYTFIDANASFLVIFLFSLDLALSSAQSDSLQ